MISFKKAETVRFFTAKAPCVAARGEPYGKSSEPAITRYNFNEFTMQKAPNVARRHHSGGPVI
jgi:hypothetical protein